MVDDSSPWVVLGPLRAYRYIRYRAPYPPDDPYNDSHGRFNNGVRLVLYVGETAAAATAEFYRRNPEFLADQTIARIQVFALDLIVAGRCLDLRTAANAAAVGVPFERLRSNDVDETARYAECRLIADEVEPLGSGLAYPSAAVTLSSAWCLVLFGRATAATWQCEGYSELPVPTLADADVRRVPA
ncbi:MAG: RES domain-containing protein [Acidimicrobiales bacterium]